jgi:hypothetical protein
MKRQKKIVEELKLQNRNKHFRKKPEHNPLLFERACPPHFQLDWNIFYRFGCARWRTTKLI